jgi:PAS domain S-box-containing protein
MRLREFFETFPLPVIGIDRKRRVALWNAAAERLLGWPAAEVLGHPDPSVPPEVAAEHKTMWDASFRGDFAAQRESMRVTRDGRTLDVEITSASIPATEEGGETALTVLFDVSERRSAEERLAEREIQLRLMLEQLPAIVSTYDHDGVFTSTQGAGLRELGLEAGALVGQRLADVVGGEELPTVVSLNAALRGESTTNEFEFKGRVYENRSEPLRRPDGTIAGAINLGFDVTERRGVETELRQSREQLRRLSATMNKIEEDERRRIAREMHDELGQLLTALRLDISIMRRDLRTVPTATLEERMRTMIDLVDLTIKTVRRVATELRPAILDDFGLRAAVEHEVAAFAERTGIAVKLSISNDGVVGPDCASALYRMVQEALTNVARHSGATRVEVRIEGSEERVEAELRDNGRGITEAEVNSLSTLGLVGVRERAYALGGNAIIEAMPGAGTRIFVCIPLSITEAIRR